MFAHKDPDRKARERQSLHAKAAAAQYALLAQELAKESPNMKKVKQLQANIQRIKAEGNLP